MEKTLGNRIASLRRERSMTQETLAAEMGVSPQAVSKWENDQTCPDISLLPQLAALLNVSVDELLSGKQESQPPVQLVETTARKSVQELVLRITVESPSGDKVRVNLPMLLVQAALDMGIELSQISNKSALKGIDLNQIMYLAQQGVVGNLVEAESADGDIVRVYVE